MTHEQKPQSAEFRTRAEQIVMIMCEARYSDIIREKGLEELFDTILAEAEARGAAEQRRKDAEGAETHEWKREAELFQQMVRNEMRDWRPANVAALEARVRELEAVAKVALEWIDAVPEETRAALPTMPGFDRDWADNVVADIREGEQS